MAAAKRSPVTGLINDLFHMAMEVQELYLRHCPFQDLSMSEMHVIEAISLEEEPTMTHVSNRLMVTMGTLTTAVSKIVEKGYIKKEKSQKDGRVYYLSLTAKGEQALAVHDSFHKKLEATILDAFKNDDYEWIVQRLSLVLERLREERNTYMKKSTE